MTSSFAHGGTTTTRSRKTLYWLTTGFAALSLSVIGSADIALAPAVTSALARLGYPVYFGPIIGIWKLLGSAAILAPGLPRLKEWAYAGMFFTLSGAVMSHAATADPDGVFVPLLLLGVVVASWALQPARGATVTAAPRPEREVWMATPDAVPGSSGNGDQR